MNLLLSCIGRRGYLADWFREHLEPGDRIIGTSVTPWTPGFHACDLGVLVPEVSSPAYVPAMLDLCRKERIDVLLSCFDLDVLVLSQHRDRFLDLGVVPVIPDVGAAEIGLDKVATAQLLEEQGLNGPATYADLEPARAALQAGRLHYPVIVKARRGFASRNLFVARSNDELDCFFHYAPDMIVQEQLPGTEHSLDVLNDLEGRVVSVVVKQKLLMRAGETDQARTVDLPAALDLGVRLGQALGHRGPLDVDLFVDGKALAILEFNPRFGGAYPVSHLAGADFPRKILDMVRGRSLEEEVGCYERDVGMMKDYRILPAYEGALGDLRSGSGSTSGT